VDRGVHADEPLSGGSRLEPLHIALSPFELSDASFRRGCFRSMRVAGEFVWNVHQDVAVRIACFSIENEIKLHVLVANDNDVIPHGPVRQVNPAARKWARA
jgi:hypothetical protein